MTTATIPAWTSAGVVPPIRPGQPGHSPDRSPYVATLASFCDRFATSPERRSIIDGLLRFRAALHQAGLTSGFQWLDGSFLEQIEDLESRSPRDMDVVTFYSLPAGVDQRTLAQNHADLFDQASAKDQYSMDAYFIMLGNPLDTVMTRRVAYWYSMWSHRRDGLWKGFVQVDLDPMHDAEARHLLNRIGGSSDD